MRGRMVGFAFYVSVYCVLVLAIAGITTYVYADVGVGQLCQCVSSPPNPAGAAPQQICVTISPPAILEPLSGYYTTCPGALMYATASGGVDTDWLLNGNLPNIDDICTSYWPLYIRVCCNDWLCFPNYNCPGSDKTTTCWQSVSNADKNFAWLSSSYIIGHAVDVYSAQNSRCYIEAAPSDNDLQGFIAAYRQEATTYQEVTPSKTATVLYSGPWRAGVSVCAHESLGLTQSNIDTLLRSVTEQVILKDEYGGGIIGRYYDNTDSHCCKGVFCSSFSTFTNDDVMPGNMTFLTIDNQAEFYAIKGSWSNPASKKQVVIVEGINVREPLGGFAFLGAYPAIGGLYLSYSTGELASVFAHEWGHYKGSLLDEYECVLCRKTPSACTCVCKDNQKKRFEHPSQCDCKYFNEPEGPYRGFVNPDPITNNIMTLSGRGVRANQCSNL